MTMKHEQFRLTLIARSQEVRSHVLSTHLVDVLVRQAHDGKPQQVIGVLVELHHIRTQAVHAFKQCDGGTLLNINVVNACPQAVLDASALVNTRSFPTTMALSIPVYYHDVNTHKTQPLTLSFVTDGLYQRATSLCYNLG